MRQVYMYIPGIETGIKLVQGWYYLRSLPGWYQYKLVLVQGWSCTGSYQPGSALDTSVLMRCKPNCQTDTDLDNYSCALLYMYLFCFKGYWVVLVWTLQCVCAAGCKHGHDEKIVLGMWHRRWAGEHKTLFKVRGFHHYVHLEKVHETLHALLLLWE
jgi:hypothetical protein